MVILRYFILLTVVCSTYAAKPLSQWVADSAISRGQADGTSVSYETGTFQRALYALYLKSGNSTYYNYIKTATDRTVTSTGTVPDFFLTDYQLDDLKLGESFVYLNVKTNATKYKTAADTFISQLATHPRTAEKGLWHKKAYPNQQWLDGQYMLLPFYASYTLQYQPTNQTAWDDILLQLTLVHTHCIQSSTGLIYHGYDYSKKAVWANSVTGASPEVWDRALGWWGMALVDLLDYVPTTQTALRSQILTYVKELAPALTKAADSSTGVWWLVMSQAGRSGNYFESSGSSMFIYFLLKASRLGYIDAATYVPVAKTAYAYASKTWIEQESDGTLGWLGTVSVGSLSGNGTFEYYISVATAKNDLKGLSPFILASVEYERL